MLVHRINGYLVTVLSVVGTVAAIMIARRAAGGGADVQSLVGVLAIAFVGSLVMGIINIKKLQIEQHRAWMIRAWAYVSAPNKNMVYNDRLLIMFVQ